MSEQSSSSPPLAMDLPPTHQTSSGIAPKFPPQNFEVPDINFSNSVTTDYDHSSSLFPSDHAGFVPLASRSPSSGSDSDDLPLAQLAKRVNIAASPSPSSTSISNEAKQGSPGPGTNRKAKAGKKKKKKDPNEPQKPVSAYALFFRDTQATIKGHNPNASFGEISKIVASMWDQLDPDHKENYKKKTEMEKKKYLKQLALYRANQVSQSAPEESDKTLSPSPPSSSSTSSVITSSSSTNPVNSGQVASGSIHPMMTQQQNMVSVTSPIMQQQIHNSPPQQPLQQSTMTPISHLQPSHAPYTSPPQSGPPATSYQSSMDHSGSEARPTHTNMQMESQTNPLCNRSGCGNNAVKNPGWDNDYCSNECVVTHCRDIFSNWVAQRSESFQVS